MTGFVRDHVAEHPGHANLEARGEVLDAVHKDVRAARNPGRLGEHIRRDAFRRDLSFAHLR